MRLTIVFHETTLPDEVTKILQTLLPDEYNVESIHNVPDEGVNIATYNLPWRTDQDLFVAVFPEGTPAAFMAQRTYQEWQRKFPSSEEIRRTRRVPTLDEMNPIRHADPVMRTIGGVIATVLYVTFSCTYSKDACELLKGYPEHWVVTTDHTQGKLGEMFHSHAEEYESEIESSDSGAIH